MNYDNGNYNNGYNNYDNGYNSYNGNGYGNNYGNNYPNNSYGSYDSYNQSTPNSMNSGMSGYNNMDYNQTNYNQNNYGSSDNYGNYNQMGFGTTDYNSNSYGNNNTSYDQGYGTSNTSYDQGYNNNTNYNTSSYEPIETFDEQLPALAEPPAPVDTTPAQSTNDNSNNNNTGFGSGNLYDFSGDLKTNKPTLNNNLPKKKKKKMRGLIAFIEFLIIIFLILFILNEKGYMNNAFFNKISDLIPTKKVEKQETKEEEKKEEPKKEEEPKETKVTEESLVEEMTKKAYYVSNVGVHTNNIISPIFGKTTKLADLTPRDRLQAIAIGFLSIDQKFAPITDVNEFKEIFPTYQDTQAQNVAFITAADVAGKYKAVFGEDVTPMNIEDICPKVIYSEKYSKYYLDANCEAQDITKNVDQYVYDLTEDNNNYYVYVATAFSTKNADGTYTVYKNFEMTDKFNDYTQQTYASFSLNASTYTNFNKYKYTFTKKDNVYIFSQIERIEEKNVEET